MLPVKNSSFDVIVFHHPSLTRAHLQGAVSDQAFGIVLTFMLAFRRRLCGRLEVASFTRVNKTRIFSDDVSLGCEEETLARRVGTRLAAMHDGVCRPGYD